jgi:nicotinamidase-related amidase
MPRDLEVTRGEFGWLAAMHAQEMYDWYANLPTLRMAELVPNAKAAERTAVFSADMINGFCKEGALASERIGAISKIVASLFNRMHRRGIRNFIFVQEWHQPDAKEFQSYPSHCVAETSEAETIPDLQKFILGSTQVYLKNSLSPAFSHSASSAGPSFEGLLKVCNFRTIVVVGNCTDLCVRELAMYLRMWANEYQQDLRIIIPANCVETFDMSSETARAIEQENNLPKGSVKPHSGDLMHVQALYEMSRNGIEVVKEIL